MPGRPRSRTSTSVLSCAASSASGPFAARVDLVALAPQRTGQRLGDRVVVLGEEYAHHAPIVGGALWAVSRRSRRSPAPGPFRPLRRTGSGSRRAAPATSRGWPPPAPAGCRGARPAATSGSPARATRPERPAWSQPGRAPQVEVGRPPAACPPDPMATCTRACRTPDARATNPSASSRWAARRPSRTNRSRGCPATPPAPAGSCRRGRPLTGRGRPAKSGGRRAEHVQLRDHRQSVAVALGRQAGHVGPLEQLLGVGRPPLRQPVGAGQADRQADAVRRCPGPRGKVLGHRRRRHERRGQHRRELVATGAGGEPVADHAHRRRHRVGDGAQRLVAGRVPEAVVGTLEPVDVADQHGHRGRRHG